jgi:hypothetical protein
MDLAQLIDATKGDRSYETLARAAGGAPGAKRWHQLATKPIKNFPDPPTVRAVSKALGVTEAVVVLAAARSLGLDASGSDSLLATLLPSRAGQLTPKQVAAVRQVVMAMVEPHEEKAPAGDRVTELREEVRRRRAGGPVPEPTDQEPAAAREGVTDLPPAPGDEGS